MKKNKKNGRHKKRGDQSTADHIDCLCSPKYRSGKKNMLQDHEWKYYLRYYKYMTFPFIKLLSTWYTLRNPVLISSNNTIMKFSWIWARLLKGVFIYLILVFISTISYPDKICLLNSSCLWVQWKLSSGISMLGGNFFFSPCPLPSRGKVMERIFKLYIK